MQDVAEAIRAEVERASAVFRRWSDGEVSAARAAGKWSRKQILGHLIDSAANNHQRFVRAASQDDLIFSGYAQDEWVRAQQYATAPWHDVITLWHGYNRHLARVMAAVPADIRHRKHHRHNMHQLGWQPYAADKPATLDDLMHDYVLHLEHHLSQVRDRARDASGQSAST